MNARSTAPDLFTTQFSVSTSRHRSDVATVIFDLDGVLVDSHHQIDHALTQWAHSRNVDLRRWKREAHALTD